jgi:hypothetical protein
MSNDKKQEKPNRPRNVVTITLDKELRRQLEEERERRGGDKSGVKLSQVARDKLAKGLDSGKK